MNRRKKLCCKCKRPIKGHPKPTGANCVFGICLNTAPVYRESVKKPPRCKPTKESYFDVSNREMLVCACCGRYTSGASSEEIHLYSIVSKTSDCHGNYDFLNRMLARLKYSESVPVGVSNCYNLHHRLGLRFQKLASIPLDIRGVVCKGSHCEVVLRFCFECRDVLICRRKK